MKKYFIVNGKEYLCKSKGNFTGELGDKRSVLVYWSKFPEKRRLKYKNKYYIYEKKDRLRMNIFRALFELYMIKIFARDLNPKLKKVIGK